MTGHLQFGKQGKGAADPFGAMLVALGGAAFYAVVAYAMIALTRGGGQFAAVWLPNALAVAALLRLPRRIEPPLLVGVFGGSLVANVAGGFDPLLGMAFAACNLVEIAFATHVVRRLCGERPDMTQPVQLAKFCGVAVIAAPLISSGLAWAALAASGAPTAGAFVGWLVPDAMGMLIVAPIAMIFVDAWRARRRTSKRRMFEWIVLTIGGTAATVAIFAQSSYPLLFLAAPIVLVHAFRLGAIGTAFSVVKIAVVATLFTTWGSGPMSLIDGDQAEQMATLQVFLASAFLCGLPVAALLEQRDRGIRKLARQGASLRLLADNITDAILRFDLDGVCTYASPSVRAVLGVEREVFLGQKATERMHAEARDAITAAEARLLSGEIDKERFSYRRFLDDEDGNPVYIEADCAIARNLDTGAREGIIVSARDVTERVDLERKLVRARRHAENAAAAKSRFLANMSHEIRTPMNGVLGFAELLLQTELDYEQRRHAELIAQSGRSMMLLLNDILDISKIEAGQIKMTPEPTDLPHLLKDCVRLHAARAEQKGLRLALEKSDDLPPRICVDGLRLRQIVLNLIGNAVKFTENGTVTLSARRTGEMLELSVSDTGIGIDAQRLEAIFRPFEQADGHTARSYGGTGLGLSISRQLSELLGGTLSVESRTGQGSRFTVMLPIEETDEHLRSARVSTMDEVEMPPSARVLLAEDHDVNRMLVSDMLERCGQFVSIAEDGLQAIDRVRAAHGTRDAFDLVLMDVQMPGCDGYAATRAIREAGIGAGDLPIVALTANAFAEDIAEARDAGMQGHLAKPLQFEELVVTLKRMLPGAREPMLVATTESAEAAAPSAHSLALQERWEARRSEAIDAVNAALASGDFGDVDITALARTVHKLAGSAGMFGEDELGARASAFERALKGSADREECVELAQAMLAAA